MNKHTAIEKFWTLHGAHRSAALDINTETGELLIRCSKSKAGEEGLGVIPIPMTDKWARICTTIEGKVFHWA